MILSTEIQIERGASFFPVTVIRGSICLGYYENPETGEETKYVLTEIEQEEAREKMYPDDLQDQSDASEREFHHPTPIESDDAANAYAGYIGLQADRRAAR